ncbi:DMT family transporter [Candidatus Sulfurimonas marisnigri]|uniref:DMT family transporter n=1 Tax=Candidatus Sulfurimonas marisnigri TaxID=2740405 RepID=A0A7S7M0M4_9BACT|nr:DMT family transporter [Candidatus Sulfurimonas marisnigri]QOY54820.1 DMT family transporter [Candidatus Sulfurimonas marisnigri]
MKNINFTYLLVLSMLLWGGGWSALKILTYDLSIEVIIFWRFFIMSLSFIPILYFIKKPIILNKSTLTYIVGSSTLNIAFMVSSFLGIKYGLAGAGGVIITTMSPIMTSLLVLIIFKSKLNNRQYFGLFLGLIGGVIMLELGSLSQFLNGSNIYFLLCAIIWAGVTVLSQHSQRNIHPVHYSFFISIVATVVTFLYAFNSDLMSVFNQGSKFWIALIYLAVLGQSVATTIFFTASGKLGSEKTSSFMFLVPLFALLIAWVVLDEEIQTHIIIGGALSLFAVYFINKKVIN